MPAHCSPPFEPDSFVAYTKTMKRVYGKDCPLMSRETWDAACKEPRGRKLTDDQFDDNQFSMENGDGQIY
jgi:hypothetical protein